ncbi:MAG: phosphatidylserine decarboxylase family protein [Candidatus Methylacidiphilales bacterium]|nr:phosphatidylserine decarboxylase family protein [Candidatus Methylacidiphilales bacterium]
MALHEARPFLIVTGLITVLAAWISLPFALLPGLAFAYILYFFRDPERPIPPDPLDIVSPADGRVISVEILEETAFQHGPMRRIAVFLSVFDVHVNRMPVAGRIIKSHHHAGEFLDARNPEIDVRNEAQNWLIETDRGPVVVRQIAGLIARRIVAWAREGDSLDKGQRFGMIRFGSRTDVYLPVDCEVAVKAGDRVQGGSSVIARWPAAPQKS